MSMTSHPYHGHGPGTRRSIRSTPTRNLPPEVWEIHRVEIVKCYIENNFSLKQLMGHMQGKFGFIATPKQWKDQFKKWDLAKNMSQKDAALILLLYNEAGSSDQRQVFLHGKYKSKGEVLKYIRKSKRVSSTDDLLNRTPVPKQIPKHITYIDAPKPNPLSILQQQRPQSDESVNVVAEIEGYSVVASFPQGQLDSQPSQDVEHSDQNEDSISETDAMVPSAEEENASKTHPTTLQGCSTSSFADNAPELSFDFLDTEAQSLLNPISTLSENQWRAPDSTTYGSLLNNMMSVTPWNFADPQIDVAAKVEEMLGSNQSLQNLDVSEMIREFLKHACKACIYHGWSSSNLPEQALQGLKLLDQALLDAVHRFNTIMQYQPQWTLTAMNNVHFLMDLYGHRVLAHRILKEIGDAVTQHWGSNNHISQTVQFMISITAPSNEKPQYDLSMLQGIYEFQSATMGPSSPVTLTAQYNLAWATLENASKEENDSQKQLMLGQARDLLESMTDVCDTVLGRHQIQSLHCVTTLARVHLLSGQGIAAEYMINKDFIPRVEACFAKTHPFFWACRFRRAVFTLEIAKDNVRPERREEYWQEGVNLLLDVLWWRVQNLGPNPHTTRTVTVLRYWLDVAQEKSDLFRSMADMYQSRLDSITNSM